MKILLIWIQQQVGGNLIKVLMEHFVAVILSFWGRATEKQTTGYIFEMKVFTFILICFFAARLLFILKKKHFLLKEKMLFLGEA